MISGNMVGSYSQIGKTFILVDESGNEITGVCVNNPVVFTAGDNDVREGSVYAGNEGVSVGSKIIPIYQSRYGCKILQANTNITIDIPEYNYNNLSIVISKFDTNIAESILSTFVSVDNCIYVAGSDVKVSDIIVDTDNEQINLNITINEKSVLRYFVTREEY